MWRPETWNIYLTKAFQPNYKHCTKAGFERKSDNNREVLKDPTNREGGFSQLTKALSQASPVNNIDEMWVI